MVPNNPNKLAPSGAKCEESHFAPDGAEALEPDFYKHVVPMGLKHTH
jgi:hypothetical protein